MRSSISFLIRSRASFILFWMSSISEEMYFSALSLRCEPVSSNFSAESLIASPILPAVSEMASIAPVGDFSACLARSFISDSIASCAELISDSAAFRASVNSFSRPDLSSSISSLRSITSSKNSKICLTSLSPLIFLINSTTALRGSSSFFSRLFRSCPICFL